MTDQNWCKILTFNGYTFLFFKGEQLKEFDKKNEGKPCVYCQHRVGGQRYVSHFTFETRDEADIFYEEDTTEELMKAILEDSVTQINISPI